MAWQRDEANLGISGATAYSYTEVDWSVNATHAVYRHIGGVTSPYNFGATATSTLQWWESGTWHDYASGSHYFSGYGDQPICDVEDSFVRQAADRVVSLGCYTTMMGGSARAWIDYTVPHLAPSVTWASSNPVVRNSDNSITLTWNAPALEYSAMCLEVSTDGGAWSQFAVLWNTATSYEWTGCSADHSYQFRIRTNYLSSYSAYDTCATVIYMTPAAPQSISTAAAGGTNITVNLVNPSPVATKVQYEVSTDDGATWGATQDSASLTSFTVSASGTVKIRVRNYNATGTSAWLTSDTVTTICPPAKPTITSPQTGAWDVSKPLDVAWLHNSLDGSAQEAYKLRVTKLTPPLASHTETYSPSTASTQSITWADVQGWLPTLALGDSMAVGIATKGADASYSSFGTSAGITPFTAPTLSITSPSATVTGMPIQIEAAYSDMAGFTCQAATVTLKSGDRTILTKPATISGTSLTCDISLSDALLDNGAEYTIVLDVRSSSGLQATANATFTTAFTEPQAGTLSITNDPDTGYASLLATFDNHATDVEYSGATNEQFDTTEGYVRSLTVEGKSEKWNQLTNLKTYDAGTVNNVAVSANGSTVTLSGTANASGGRLSFNFISAGFDVIAGHKYAPINETTAAFYWQAGNTIVINGLPEQTVQTASANATITSLGCNVVESRAYSDTNKHVALYDLTAIFGSGNEPATVDAFKATDVYKAKLAAGELYAYDAGSLVSIEGAGVWSQELPEGYEPCGYVESLRYGNAIKTGVIPTENFGIDITFLTNDEIGSNSYGCICGGRVSSGNKDFQLTTYSETPSTYQGSLRGGSNSANPAITVGIKQRVFWKNGSLTRADGVTLAYSPNQAGEYEIYLFALNNGGAIAQCNIKPARIYRATFFDGNTTIADFVPCIHGDEVGFYDLVGNEFHGNFGSVDALAAGYDDWAPTTTTITIPLRSAGSVHDELQVDETEAQVTRRVGVVDLGTLTWVYVDQANRERLYTAGISSLVKHGVDTAVSNILCSRLTSASANDTYLHTVDNSISITSVGQVQVYASAYTDAASFKTAMSGVYLYYELAAPTTDTLPDVPLIELSTAATVTTDLDSTFSMVGWDGSADAVSISVARVNADGITPLIEDAASGVGAVDKYAPLNTPYQYAVTTKSSANAVKTVYVDNEIITDLWFAYWGDNIASAKWNPDNGGIQIARPQKTRVYYAGRKDPVSYDGSAVSLTETPSWMIVDRSEVQPFVQLIEDGGRGVYKSCDGWVYHADFDLTLTPKYTAIGYYGGVGLSVTRIAGEQL